MEKKLDKVNLQPAFVIKNYMPLYGKVMLLHMQYGKIVCIFPYRHQAALLTTGSLIECWVYKRNQFFQFVDLEIINCVSLQSFNLMHQIMKICLRLVPTHIAVPELFDFLLYVRHNVTSFDELGEKIILLRLFLMFDVLPHEPEFYQAAVQDPHAHERLDLQKLNKYVDRAWDNFYQHCAQNNFGEKKNG